MPESEVFFRQSLPSSAENVLERARRLAGRQLRDGTVIWTSPSGKKYTTKPGNRLFFTHWNTTTADLPHRHLVHRQLSATAA